MTGSRRVTAGAGVAALAVTVAVIGLVVGALGGPPAPGPVTAPSTWPSPAAAGARTPTGAAQDAAAGRVALAFARALFDDASDGSPDRWAGVATPTYAAQLRAVAVRPPPGQRLTATRVAVQPEAAGRRRVLITGTLTRPPATSTGVALTARLVATAAGWRVAEVSP